MWKAINKYFVDMKGYDISVNKGAFDYIGSFPLFIEWNLCNENLTWSELHIANKVEQKWQFQVFFLNFQQHSICNFKRRFTVSAKIWRENGTILNVRQ